ncbi:MAG: glycerol-3-phosphate acyltransferase [Bacteroidetes bacterium]|nr:glycerol-3-phosphate acyltransferase [Bacteroidota bacterium]
MNYLIAILTGYLLGSFPTAYVLLKKYKQIDIRQSGSQNVGALNSYEVSESKLIGLSVLLIDALKGFLTVLILKLLFPDEFIYPAMGLTAAVFAHCYSPWIKFKGGRGLATAAGGAAYLAPVILLLWCILWVIAYIFRRDIHIGNIMATVLLIALVISSGDILLKYSFPPAENEIEFIIPVALMLFIIFIKHRKPLMEWIGKHKVKKRDINNE